MVRATAAQMLVLYGGKYPPPHDAASFTAIALHADALIDAYCLPATLSTTDTSAIGVANRIAAHMVIKSLWLAAGGELTGKPHPELLHKSMTDLLDKCLMDTTADSFHALDMIDEDA